MSPSVNAAIVGYGYAGRSLHAPLIRLEPRLRIHGVVARDPAKRVQARADLAAEPAERRYDVLENVVTSPRPTSELRTYASVEECLNDAGVDLVVVATPHDSHAAIAIEALRAGKHVIVDKPICLTLAECDAMIAAARGAKRLLTVFHNRRWDGDVLTLRSLLDSGQLGDLRWVELSWNRHGLSTRSAWRNDPAYGPGRVVDLGVHLVDRAVTLFPGDRVAGVTTRVQHDWPDSSVPSSAMVTLAFASGRTCVIDVSSMTRYAKPAILAVGTAGTFVKWGEDPQEAALLAGDVRAARDDPALHGRLVTSSGERRVEPVRGDWPAFYTNVADVLLDGITPAVTLDEMRRVMEVMEAVNASAASSSSSSAASTVRTLP